MPEPELTGPKPTRNFFWNVPDGANVWPLRDSSFASARFSAQRLWWVNLILLCATIVTTTVFGFALVESFSNGQPFDIDRLADAWVRFAHLDRAVWSGLDFSAPLLLILLAHEFGHYFACARQGVNASLPYFLPSPLLLGTFGAFIRMRSPIYTRKSLLEVGIAGPIAGFVVLLPFLIAGVCLSRVMPGFAAHSPYLFGTPLALRIVEWLRFRHVSHADIALHPMALAAWGGLFATAFNLLPMGQFDGGHILYAVFGPRGHRLISSAVIAVLALLGFLWLPWAIWAAIMFFVGRRHPLVYDSMPVSKRHLVLSSAALLLFILSFSVVPIIEKR